MRNRAERRHYDWIKAIRKKKLSDAWLEGHHYYNNLHEYSKNKIHCSCAICSNKTDNKGRHKSWESGSKNWKHSDMQKIERLESQLNDEE